MLKQKLKIHLRKVSKWRILVPQKFPNIWYKNLSISNGHLWSTQRYLNNLGIYKSNQTHFSVGAYTTSDKARLARNLENVTTQKILYGNKLMLKQK